MKGKQKQRRRGPKVDWMIVGLGNPGPEYEGTRHNIGWSVAKVFAFQHHCFDFQKRDGWMECLFTFKGKRIAVILPMLYMNNSGEAVASAQEMYNVPISRIVVIVDEYNFPVGRIHLRRGGGPGGHNGVASIIEHLGTTEFWRLRCGIGRNFGPGGMAQYVLSPFAPEEEQAKMEMLEDAVRALDKMILLGPERAMTEVNAESREKFGHLPASKPLVSQASSWNR